ncbi:uncharacterized protein [Drosophila bipectinata]|uniref:uncharacterized protein n=1 Tax=Drosophila bipectinata TaxID=42026 RepID=UPI001C89D09D|nr:uncharacterized protein LOC108121266 [Drosophila bipectinata]
MSESSLETNLTKSILTLKEQNPNSSDEDGDESVKPKKHVTFNRVVQYYAYSDKMTCWRRCLLAENDMHKCQIQDEEDTET